MKFRWETKFKETEIGEIPRDWGVETLSWAVKNLESGNRPKGGILKHDPTGILSIGGENITWQGDLILDNCLRFSKEFYESLTKGKIEKEDILLVKDGATIGKLVFIKEIPEGKAMVNEHVFLIKTDKEKYDPRYLFYYLFSEIGQSFIESSISGSAQGGINKSILDTVKIPKLNLPEQSRIATVLSWFDDLIENKKRQNEILEKTAMAIFKNWFIDFEPFKEGEFVDSELGKIPKGWEVKKLGEIAIGFKGVSYNSPDISSEPQGNIFITLNNFIRGGGFKTEYIYYIGNKAKEQHKVKEGDLIIALTDMTYEAKVVGAPAFVFLPEEYDFGIISLDCMKLQPIYEYLKLYLYLHLKQTQEENSTFANGVNVLHLNVRLFMQNKMIIFPPPSILQKFHSLVEPLFQKIILNQKQIMLLRKIRDKLLPLLVFGKLRVEEI